MHDRLINYINSYLPKKLNPEEERLVVNTFKHKRIKKHQFILQEGEICKTFGFVAKGALRQYSVDEHGRENILVLCIENWWAGDRESFMKETPSPFFIDALEDTDMLFLQRQDADAIQKLPFMNELGLVLAERQAVSLLKRIHAANTLTAEQRLAELEQTHPAFLQRFPQHIIASYLGMTKETLSRIRANASRK